MNDIQMKTLGVLVSGGYVPIDRFRSEELAAIDDLVSLGYALVNPAEPVREAYATDAGRKALAIEKEVRCQRAEQNADEERRNVSERQAANKSNWFNLASAVIGAAVGSVATWLLERLF